MRLMLARISGTTANQMLMVALGWQMYDLTGSAWDLGLVGLYQFVPALLLTLPAGHLADRYDRRALLAISLVIQAVVAMLLLAGSGGQWIDREVVLATSILLGAARALQMPSLTALTPSLVPAELLPRAVAISSTAMQAAIVAGPALGGALYAWGPRALALAGPSWRHAGSGPAAVYLMSLLLLAAAVLAVAAIRTPSKAAQQGAANFETLTAGVRMFGVSTIVFGLSTHFGLSLVALAVSGASDMVSVVLRQSLVQLETPDEMRGRVAAVNAVFIGASNQLGEFESGLTAAWWGPVAAVVAGGVGTLLVVATWTRLFPALAHRDQLYSPQPAATH
ncbi:MAG: MFS transporter [Ideonella sp. MAG2]|nr:MAG: MFS transporter [Ideonella sp. MAG2]